MNRTMVGTAAFDDTETEKRSPRDVLAELGFGEDAAARRWARLAVDARVHKLAEVRRRQRYAQRDLARMLGISRSRVSKLERQCLDDVVLSTLTSYVEALGGRLRVVADFGDELLVLSGIPFDALDVASDEMAPEERLSLGEHMKAKYETGTTIRALADETGLSYQVVRRMLTHSGVILRGRSGRIKPPSSWPYL